MKKNRSYKEIESEIIKTRSNVFYGCYKCRTEWSESDYEEKEYKDGQICPKCKSNKTCPI